MPSSLDERVLQAQLEKLQAEVQAIHSREKAEAALATKFKSWIAVLTALVALTAGGWGLWNGISQFLDQQRQELEFQVDSSIVQLGKDLYSADDSKFESAALLLSFYEEHSVPLLAARIGTVTSPKLLSFLQSALELVATKEHLQEAPEKLVTPLLTYARRGVGQLELAADAPSAGEAARPVSNYVMVIGGVMKTVTDHKERCEAISFLTDLQSKVAAKSMLEPLTRQNLTMQIDDVLHELKGEPCKDINWLSL